MIPRYIRFKRDVKAWSRRFDGFPELEPEAPLPESGFYFVRGKIGGQPMQVSTSGRECLQFVFWVKAREKKSNHNGVVSSGRTILRRSGVADELWVQVGQHRLALDIEDVMRGVEGSLEVATRSSSTVGGFGGVRPLKEAWKRLEAEADNYPRGWKVNLNEVVVKEGQEVFLWGYLDASVPALRAREGLSVRLATSYQKVKEMGGLMAASQANLEKFNQAVERAQTP